MTEINIRDGDGRAAWRPRGHKRDNIKVIILFPPVFQAGQRRGKCFRRFRRAGKSEGGTAPLWGEQRGVGGMDDGHKMLGRKKRLWSFWRKDWSRILNICCSLAAALTPAGANQELMLPLHSPTVCWKPVCCIFPAIITCPAVFNLHNHREEECPQTGREDVEKMCASSHFFRTQPCTLASPHF